MGFHFDDVDTAKTERKQKNVAELGYLLLASSPLELWVISMSAPTYNI